MTCWLRSRFLVLSVISVVLGAIALQPAQAKSAISDPLHRPALMVAKPQNAVLIDIAKAGNLLVAVGANGIIIRSSDEGESWAQVPCPVSVTLTAVFFISPDIGWVVGQDGVVLKTVDAGQSWKLQLDGVRAAALVLESAKAALNLEKNDPAAQQVLANAQMMVAEASGNPLLDVYFLDPMNGFVIGANGLILHTDDGGTSWNSWLGHVVNPDGYDLYAIRGCGNIIYIAGERGLAYRSDDGGENFTTLTMPAADSMFTMSVTPDGGLVVAGLGGQAFRSEDKGVSWQRVQGLPGISVVDSRVGPSGSLWLATQAGQVFVSTDDASTLRAVPIPPNMPPLDALLPIRRDRVLLATMGGVILLPPFTQPE